MEAVETAINQSRHLMAAFSKYTEQMPRYFKLSHGERIVSRSVMLLDCVVEASNSPCAETSELIHKATTHLEKLREILQESLDDDVHDWPKHAELSGEIDYIERALNRWSHNMDAGKTS